MMEEILEKGFWIIGGRPFVIKKQTTNLSLALNFLTKVSIQVNLYGIPLKLWTNKGLNYVTSTLEKLLYMDKVIEEATQIRFAKVCIKFDSAVGFSDDFDLVLPKGLYEC